MRLINRCEEGSAEHLAAACALKTHQEKYGDFARIDKQWTYRIKVAEKIIPISVRSTSKSYIARSMNVHRQLVRIWEDRQPV